MSSQTSKNETEEVDKDTSQIAPETLDKICRNTVEEIQNVVHVE